MSKRKNRYDMNKWHKIVGTVIISALAIANAWAIIDYIHLAEVAGAWSAEVTQESFFDCVFYFRRHFWIYTILSIIDFFIIMTLFIHLWRKGGKR